MDQKNRKLPNLDQFKSSLKLEWMEWVGTNMFQIHELQHNWTWKFFESMMDFNYPSKGERYINIMNDLEDVELITALGDKLTVYNRHLYINGKALKIKFDRNFLT